MQTIELIAATEADFEALSALRIRAMQASLERIGRFDPQRARDRLRASYDPAATRHIVVDGKQRVGFVAVNPVDAGLMLDHLYLDLAHHGHGIGSKVLKQIFNEVDQLGLSLQVGVLRQSEANLFYLKHGFIYSHETEWDIYYVRPPQHKLE